MDDLKSKHREAMRHAERARIARLEGNEAEMVELTRRALELEREAAYGLLQEFQVEPTRSVLFRSAATLALECGETEEARRLAFQGLAGSPPQEIADELHDIVEEEQFRRHFATRGVELQPDEVQMSLAGPAIAAGIAPSSAIMSRLEGLQNLVFRTAERQAGIEYRKWGRRQQKIGQGYEMFVSAPRTGSFAFSICIGEPKQLGLPGMGKSESVMREVFECFDLLASAGEGGLSEHIGDPAYAANFIALARKIAPDGDSVRWVGLSSFFGRTSRHVEVESVSKAPEASGEKPMPDSEDLVRIQGSLRWADATGKMELVRIVDSERQSHKVRVPLGMDDIVKPYWLDEVVVTALGKGGSLVLKNIEPVRGPA